ncbi:MAG TPA: hypothetical protein ENK06_10785 [Gammaproteobacteria bacterium]|nr:hypothetical protein [Gammaproteobacteria bacterium]
MTNKSWLRLAFEAIPFHVFLEESWRFICKPEIEGDSLENSSLRYAGQNFIASLFLVTMVVAFVQYLLPQLFEVDLGQLINPVYLCLFLAVQAIVFAFILAIAISISVFPKKPAFHHLVAHQTIQAYAVLNLMVVVLFWIGMNRILKTGNFKEASSSLDLWLGGVAGLIALWLIWRLLVKPIWHYIAAYYSKKISFGVAALVFFSSSWVNSYAVFDFGSFVINKSAVCKQIYETKKFSGEIKSFVDEQCFIGHCMSKMHSGHNKHN